MHVLEILFKMLNVAVESRVINSNRLDGIAFDAVAHRKQFFFIKRLHAFPDFTLRMYKFTYVSNRMYNECITFPSQRRYYEKIKLQAKIVAIANRQSVHVCT